MMEANQDSSTTKFMVCVVYASILLDNVLLTAIVPVIPTHLSEMMSSAVPPASGSPSSSAAVGKAYRPMSPPSSAAADYKSAESKWIAEVSNKSGAGSSKFGKALTTGRLTLHRVPVRVLDKHQREKSRSSSSSKTVEEHGGAGGGIPTAAGAGVNNKGSPPKPSAMTTAEDFAARLAQHFGGGRTGLHLGGGEEDVNAADDEDGGEGGGGGGRREEERANEKIGFLLSSKALVQLVANPLVGWWANRVGYSLPLLVGTSYLLVSSLVFSFGRTYVMLFFARSLQGIASACITVAGMGLVAERYEGDEKLRSKILGHILGAVALGVLIGYPMGSILNTFFGQAAPFLVLAVCIFADTALQFVHFRPSTKSEELFGTKVDAAPSSLLKDKFVLVTVGAICCSTTAMAVLEPCLPIWLRGTIPDLKDWQLGLIFIPDSLGYLVGTNFLGVPAFKFGRWRAAALALFTTGLSACLIPLARKPWHLALPHFFLGLGIGSVDAALMPLLAYLVDTRHQAATYGTVYALAQFSVSLAYFSGPFLGGELAESIGFPWLMRIVGLTNILYAPLCCLLRYQDAAVPLLMAQHHGGIRPGYLGGDDVNEQKGFWKDLIKLPPAGTVSYKTMPSTSGSTSDLAAASDDPPSPSQSSTSTFEMAARNNAPSPPPSDVNNQSRLSKILGRKIVY